MENNYLDELAKKALDDFEVPYEPNDWLLMEARIEEEQRLRRQVYTIKAVELALMLLAIWTVSLFVFDDMEKGTPITNEGKIEQQDKEYSPSILPIEESDGENLDPNGDPIASTTEGNTNEDIVEDNGTSNNTVTTNQNVRTSSNKRGNSINEFSTKNLRTAYDYVINDNSNSYEDKNTLKIFNNAAPRNPQTTQEVNKQITKQKIAANKGKSNKVEVAKEIAANYVASLPAQELGYKRLIDVEFGVLKKEENLDPIDKVNPENKKRVSLGLLVSTDINEINTTEYAPYKQAKNFDYSAGLTANIALSNKWELETGVILSKKRYITRALLEADNSGNIQSTRDISLNVIEVPLNVQYNLKKNLNWRVYSTAGVGTHIVLFAKHTNKKYEFSSADAIVTSLAEYSQRQDKGVFSGGILNNNYYLSANMGIGVERRLSKHWHFFMQPTYKLSLSPVGYDNDAINTFSFVAGTRFML